MKKKGLLCRDKIVKAANRLFYHQGYNHTSFSDVADAVGVPKGNFYYYFKTKEQILTAIIEDRMESISKMLQEWNDNIAKPRDRLKRYAQMLVNEEKDILRYGCPMGTLNTELFKTHNSQRNKAREMFEVFRQYLVQQFKDMGFSKKQADDHAAHVLVWTQGISVMAHTYGDTSLLQKEAKRIRQWIDKL